MFSISDYLRKWFDTTRFIITQPRSFFREMPVSGSLKEPLSFMFFTIFISSLLSIPVLLLSFSGQQLIEMDSFLIIVLSVALFLLIFIMLSISVPLNTFTYHILLKICGAKGNLEVTLRVFCYYMSVSLAILPVAGFVMSVFYIAQAAELDGVLYSVLSFILILALAALIIYFAFYVLLVGFSEAHRISMKRVFLAIIVIPVGINLAFAAVTVGLVFIDSYSTETAGYSAETTLPDYESTYSLPAESKITASYGSTPVVDGHYTSDDKWYEAHEIVFISENAEYAMAAKHDNENLYILIKWNGDPVWQNSMEIRFEQDGDSHDHNLSTGHDDYKYNGAEVYGPSNLADAHNSGGVREEQDGMVSGNYSDGFWVQEWVVPLRSSDPGDVSVENIPTTLGFALIDWGPGMATGLWPAGAWPYEPETWGDLEIVE